MYEEESLINSTLTSPQSNVEATEKSSAKLRDNSGVAKAFKDKSNLKLHGILKRPEESPMNMNEDQPLEARRNFRVSRRPTSKNIEDKVNKLTSVTQEQINSQLREKMISKAKLRVKISKYGEATSLTSEELRELEALKHLYLQRVSDLNSSETSSETSSEPPSPVKKLFNPWHDLKFEEKNFTSPATESFLEFGNIKDSSKDLENLKKLEQMHPSRLIDDKEQVHINQSLQTRKSLNAKFDSLRPRSSPFKISSIFDLDEDANPIQTIDDEIKILLKAIEKYNNKIEENDIKKSVLEKEIEELKKEKYAVILEDKGSQKKLSEEESKKSSDPSADPAPKAPPRKLLRNIRVFQNDLSQ